MAHGHDILHMMEGKEYDSKEHLVEEIIHQFGTEERFHTCSADGMDAAQIVDFLDKKGKFLQLDNGNFTVNIANMCKHH